MSEFSLREKVIKVVSGRSQKKTMITKINALFEEEFPTEKPKKDKFSQLSRYKDAVSPVIRGKSKKKSDRGVTVMTKANSIRGDKNNPFDKKKSGR